MSLATTYIETPAFAGVSMYCKYNIIHRDYGVTIVPMSEVLMNKELNNNQVCDEVHLAKQLE